VFRGVRIERVHYWPLFMDIFKIIKLAYFHCQYLLLPQTLQHSSLISSWTHPFFYCKVSLSPGHTS
jgi:hypothetical protein